MLNATKHKLTVILRFVKSHKPKETTRTLTKFNLYPKYIVIRI